MMVAASGDVKFNEKSGENGGNALQMQQSCVAARLFRRGSDRKLGAQKEWRGGCASGGRQSRRVGTGCGGKPAGLEAAYSGNSFVER